jgi:hypothetical protein
VPETDIQPIGEHGAVNAHPAIDERFNSISYRGVTRLVSSVSTTNTADALRGRMSISVPGEFMSMDRGDVWTLHYQSANGCAANGVAAPRALQEPRL